MDPLNLDSARVQKIHDAQIIQKGIEETKIKVLIDKKNGSSLKKRKKDEIDYTAPMDNLVELMKPGAGVIIVDSKNQLKVGQSIQDIPLG